jgi:ABC-type antimicrobial peptide transport system permease subunit
VSTPDLATAEKFVKEIQKRTQVRINPMTERKYYEEMSKMNATFKGAAWFIAVILAIGGMFGLMNTMFAAVSQRIKDIGVLRIVGYSRPQILVSFLLEALLLAALGGGLGLLAGYLIHGFELTAFVAGNNGGGKTVVFSMLVSSSVVVAAVVYTLVMGLLGGVLPSLAAMRLRPLDAVR